MTPAERRAVDAGDQVEVELEPLEVALLLASGRYEPARGLYRGTHWRAERGKGCWHLRVVGGRGWLHLDRWDPRRFPVRHALETPELAVGGSSIAGAGVLLALRILGRV